MKRINFILFLMTVWIFMVIMAEVRPDWSFAIILMLFAGGYSLLLTVGMLHHKRKQWWAAFRGRTTPPSTYRPKISVVIPAHNEASVIEQTVRSMLELDYPDYEILVMDDRSTDGTGEVLQILHKQLRNPKFRYHIRPEEAFPGKSAVLNDALQLTDSEVIAVFDADAWVKPDFLSAIVPFLEEDHVAAVQARKMIINAKENLLTQCQDYEYAMDAHFQYGRDTVRGAVELRGNGQLVKRQALEDVGGWNLHTVTDDLDLSTKLHLAGWDIRFAHKVCVYEEGITRFAPLIRQRIRWAEGSFTRYLEYGGQVLFSNEASFRAKADMIAYFVEYSIPIWLVSDYVVVAISYFTGDMTRIHLYSLLAAAPLLTFFFIITMVVAIIRFYKQSPIPAIANAIMTSTYLVVMWIPIVFVVAVKVLLKNPNAPVEWYKTDHHGHSQTIPQSDPLKMQES